MKKLLLAACLVPEFCSAQGPAILSTLQVTPSNGFGFCEIWDGVTDAQGNTYVVGTFQGVVPFGQTTLSSGSGDSQGFIAKLDAASNWLWARRFGDQSSSDESIGLSIALDGVGGAYVAALLNGYSVTIDATAIALPFYGGLSVMKLDTGGAYAWTAASNAWGGLQCDLVADSNGSVFVAGNWNPAGDPVQFGPFLQPITGNMDDAFLGKIDASGSWVWVKTFASLGGALGVYTKDLLLDGAGNVVLGGFAYGTEANIDGISIMAHPASDPFSTVIPYVGKWDPTGTLLWLSTIGNSHVGSYWLEAMELDAGGGISAIGSVIDTVNFGPYQVIGGNGGNVGHTLARLDATGNWTDILNTQYDHALVTDLLRLATGELLGMGLHNGTAFFANDTLFCAGENDGFVAAMDDAGQWLGGTGFGGAWWDTPGRLTIGSAQIRCVGWFEDVAVFGPDTLTCPSGSSCSFITTLDISMVGVAELDRPGPAGMVLYPNPVMTRIDLSAEVPLGTSISIHDGTGRVILVKPYEGTHMILDVGGLQPGAYFIRSGRHCARFIKE